MKRLVMAAAVMAGMSGAAWAADPVEGVWQTEVDDGSFAHITMSPCGEGFCGVISKTFKEDGSEYVSENQGKTIVMDMIPRGNDEYEGQVFRPSNGKTYYGTIGLEGNMLKLSGCIIGGLICAKQNWTRVE
ncbi:DUF2147 domain-containing protein [Rhodobacteraceae bacterium HSP-20]|uniref:DUF2147 domain-containing protein n=1 Tax=Paragemmobacter amnigenus TaxID=2852097 RepID=A0ABS6J674_9RHOB|nr:DUF2147 domain-containing protein [Rhodobacter amnigenus]MBU9699259.1 DUF2147 domain-containing protein [Rhodobacter amnigenus]MBV4390486.1 DUF2147 domain-containing protein [Rhodobacter amnigenus]